MCPLAIAAITKVSEMDARGDAHTLVLKFFYGRALANADMVKAIDITR